MQVFLYLVVRTKNANWPIHSRGSLSFFYVELKLQLVSLFQEVSEVLVFPDKRNITEERAKIKTFLKNSIGNPSEPDALPLLIELIALIISSDVIGTSIILGVSKSIFGISIWSRKEVILDMSALV